jgi:hypothetical protein
VLETQVAEQEVILDQVSGRILFHNKNSFKKEKINRSKSRYLRRYKTGKTFNGQIFKRKKKRQYSKTIMVVVIMVVVMMVIILLLK